MVKLFFSGNTKLPTFGQVYIPYIQSYIPVHIIFKTKFKIFNSQDF